MRSSKTFKLFYSLFLNLPYFGIGAILTTSVFNMDNYHALFISGLLWVMKTADYIDHITLSEEIDQLHVKIDKLLENEKK